MVPSKLDVNEYNRSLLNSRGKLVIGTSFTGETMKQRGEEQIDRQTWDAWLWRTNNLSSEGNLVIAGDVVC